MIPHQPNHRTADGDHAVAALAELIGALDRRAPHVERVGEMKIAREAAALRKAASARIAHLTAESDFRAREIEHSNAVMSDDGGPALRS